LRGFLWSLSKLAFDSLHGLGDEQRELTSLATLLTRIRKKNKVPRHQMCKRFFFNYPKFKMPVLSLKKSNKMSIK
jgi:hypothetical protein